MMRAARLTALALALTTAAANFACSEAKEDKSAAAPAKSGTPDAANTAATTATVAANATADARRHQPRSRDMRAFGMRVHSMTEGAAPAGMDGKAFPLFAGGWSKEWRDGSGATVELKATEEGVVVPPATVASAQEYGDLQLHLEFRIPSDELAEVARTDLLLSGCFAVIIAESMNRPQVATGCGAISGQHPPAAPACLPPGAWQTLDIAYRAPQPAALSGAATPARITVLHNGVLVQNAVDVPKTTEARGPAIPPVRGPLVLAPKAGKVELRNLWIRALDGTLPPSATSPATAPATVPAAPPAAP